MSVGDGSKPQRTQRGVETDADGALLGALAAGDASALAEIYDRNASWMLGRAHRLLGNRRDAEDLVHDVFLEVWRKADSFDPNRGAARTWLMVKVRSRALDRLRSQSLARRHGLQQGVEENATQDLQGAADLLRCVDRSRALEALTDLPAPQRLVIELHCLQGMSCDEIARHREIPLGTVKSRLSRGLALLRGSLVPGGENGS